MTTNYTQNYAKKYCCKYCDFNASKKMIMIDTCQRKNTKTTY